MGMLARVAAIIVGGLCMVTIILAPVGIIILLLATIDETLENIEKKIK